MRPAGALGLGLGGRGRGGMRRRGAGARSREGDGGAELGGPGPGRALGLGGWGLGVLGALGRGRGAGLGLGGGWRRPVALGAAEVRERYGGYAPPAPSFPCTCRRHPRALCTVSAERWKANPFSRVRQDAQYARWNDWVGDGNGRTGFAGILAQVHVTADAALAWQGLTSETILLL